jgi:hypothetical protein
VRLPILHISEEGPGNPRPASGLLHQLETSRPIRLVLLLLLLTLLNGFDLGFTLLADHHERLIELNPVAARCIGQGRWLYLAGYKVALVTFGVSILWFLRRHVLAECAAWLAVSTYVVVAWRWHGFLNLLPTWQPYSIS